MQGVYGDLENFASPEFKKVAKGLVKTGMPLDYIILCRGEKESGKDETAKVLEKRAKEAGYFVVKTAFADELRRHLSILDPIVGVVDKGASVKDQWNNEIRNLQTITWNQAIALFGYDEAKKRFLEMRRLMQVYGTELIRDHFDQDYWTKFVTGLAERSLVENSHKPVMVIVTDCRFENERWCFDPERFGYSKTWMAQDKPYKVEMVNLFRPGRDEQRIEFKHRSEQIIDDKNYPQSYGNTVIFNDRDLGYLHEQINGLADYLLNTSNI